MVKSKYHGIGFVSGLILTLCMFYACDDSEPCSRCSSKINSAFVDQLFTVLINDADTLLVDRDNDVATAYVFMVCSAELLRPFEHDNVVKVSGSFRNLCNSAAQVIAIDEVERVTSCVPPIPQLDGPFELGSTWRIHYIQTQDTTLYPPCEGDDFVVFDPLERSIHSHPSINSCMGTYTIVNDSTIQIPDDFECTLAVGNRSQSYFEGVFNDVIDRGSIITYSITKNILVLKNKANESMIRLFVTE